MYHNIGDFSKREGYDFDQLFGIAKVQVSIYAFFNLNLRMMKIYDILVCNSPSCCRFWTLEEVFFDNESSCYCIYLWIYYGH